jgi:hypothetical protein
MLDVTEVILAELSRATEKVKCFFPRDCDKANKHLCCHRNKKTTGRLNAARKILMLCKYH